MLNSTFVLTTDAVLSLAADLLKDDELPVGAAVRTAPSTLCIAVATLLCGVQKCVCVG
jgi:hypothetical protein